MCIYIYIYIYIVKALLKLVASKTAMFDISLSVF